MRKIRREVKEKERTGKLHLQYTYFITPLTHFLACLFSAVNSIVYQISKLPKSLWNYHISWSDFMCVLGVDMTDDLKASLLQVISYVR